jgi:hypothetical protein
MLPHPSVLVSTAGILATMIACPDCTTTLSDVPFGEPCPKCGSLRRDAVVEVPTLGAMTQLLPANVSASVDALIAIPEVREALESHEITIRFTPPSTPEHGWLVEARDGDDLIAFVPGPEFDDDQLATADEIEPAIRPADEE